MADVSKIKRMIGQCSDASELRAIKRHVQERIDLLAKRAWQERVDEQWALIKSCSVGDTLYCCAEGHFLGGRIQRGDALRISHIQPRAKRVWFYGDDGKPHGSYMDQVTATRYHLRKDAPSNPLSDSARKSAEVAGRAIQRAMADRA